VNIANNVPVDQREKLTEIKKECGVNKAMVPGLK